MMSKQLIALGFSAAVLAACSQPAPEAPSPDPLLQQKIDELAAAIEELKSEATALTAPPQSTGPAVYFANLSNGQEVTSPFRVVFGLSNYGVAPALTEKENTGHHHLLINETLEGEELDYAIPADAQHLHFGGGQTETVLDLPPGQHTLQLVLGDLNHEILKPPVMSERITITVRQP